MYDVLKDTTKFVKVPNIDLFKLTLKLEDKITRLIKQMSDLGTISTEIAHSLKPIGSSLATLYGLPKIHKPNIPLRPILAAYNSASHKLSKFFVSILSNFTSNEYSVSNSYDLNNSLSGMKLPPSAFLCSFDISSLFTNVPVNETINICSDLAFSNNDIFMGMTKKFFKNVLGSCVKNCHFFNNEIFKQIDGVAMGGPLGPTFANTFLCYWEEFWLDECPLAFRPLLYRRYVDDTLLIFKDKSHAPLFLNYLNNKHPNINFTIENEINGKLPFLDLLLTKMNDSLLISLYRKPTFSGLGISFFSYCSYKFKINSIKTLIHRAYNLTSTYSLFHDEVNFLKQYFINNGFTSHIFHKYVNRFLSDIYQPKLPTHTVDKLVSFISLPYLGQISDRIEKSLDNILSKSYPQIQFKFIHKNDFKIRTFFCFKDRVPTLLRSSIVYKFLCPSCQTGYIGSTMRTFKARIDEHKGQSSRTGLPLSVPPHSAVREHCFECNISVKSEDFSIINSTQNYNLRILESLHILRDKPSLNNNQSAFPLNIFP